MINSANPINGPSTRHVLDGFRFAQPILRSLRSLRRKWRAGGLQRRRGRRFGSADWAIVFARRERTLRRTLYRSHLPIGRPVRGLGEPRLLLSTPAPQGLAALRRRGGHRFALKPPPCRRARHRATNPATGPDKLEGQEVPPRVVALHERARDQVPRDRRSIDPLPAERAGKPNAGLDFTDLRHAVNGNSHLSRPETLELNRPELRISRAKRAFEPLPHPLQIARPRRSAAGP